MFIAVSVRDGETIELLCNLAVITSRTPVVQAAYEELARRLGLALLQQDDAKAVEHIDLFRLLSFDTLGCPLQPAATFPGVTAGIPKPSQFLTQPKTDRYVAVVNATFYRQAPLKSGAKVV